MKRVTDLKLVRASNALHALLQCDDFADRLNRNRDAVVERFERMSGGHTMPHVDEPSVEYDVFMVAITLSDLLSVEP